uniref:Ig-like domain-containing protein n=1 Tax=Canis lupus familiaris TaxID=9615 RepID=A0A8C0LXJ3_CANLF
MGAPTDATFLNSRTRIHGHTPGPTVASCSLGPNVGLGPLSATVPFHAGAYREPSLMAQPGSLVHSGDNLTLQCRSEAGFDRFALTKDEELRPAQHLDGQPSPDFPLDPVSRTHGGRYRCYSGHNLSSTWSEGSLAPPQHLHLQDTAIPYEVNFTLNPVTSDHQGTYRCYSSHNSSPYLLSSPSDSLELLVSATPSPNYTNYTVGNCVPLSVAGMVLLILVVILAEAWYSQSRSQQGVQGWSQEVSHGGLNPRVSGGTLPGR